MDERIHDFKSLVGPSVDRFARSILARNKRAAPLQFQGIEIPSQKDAVRSVEAEVEAGFFAGALGWQGRWLARCPTEDCSGAQVVTAKEPFFLCLDCFNRDNEGQWFKVRFPRSKARIEAVLLKRPPKNRNYRPGETLEQLRAENRAHGFEV
jgi:hypothetical protein